MKNSQNNGPQLITYVDRLGGDLKGLRTLLNESFPGAFGGVHLLPYFTPYDGVDAGFDPSDHTMVDPRLGTWEDVKQLSDEMTVVSDVIVNHVSVESERFKDFQAKGADSEWADMFLTMSSIFPDSASEKDLARIYRPRPGLPFTLMEIGGQTRLVWTTFTGQQVDIDLRNESAWDYLISVIDALTEAGVSILRLDAVGYTGKERGTNCFMTPTTQRYLDRIMELARERDAKVLLEIHGHYTQQIEVAAGVDYVYDFALPPLTIHALHTGDLAPLDQWLRVRPENSITVLDTHDGIGIVDVGENDLAPGLPGLLPPAAIDSLVKTIHDVSYGGSLAATGAAASNLDLYQVNCTFYDSLGRDDRKYLLARLIQLMTPGIPQIYYVGLLAGENDMELLERTGTGRDINRHIYSPEEIREALARKVVQAQVEAIRLRNTHPAFAGEFSYDFQGSRGFMQWRNGSDSVTLDFDAADSSFELQWTGPEGQSQSWSDARLA